MNPQAEQPRAATRNACKLCAPLGACAVFSGIEGCVPFLHGSQGCATYIRRYMISHFREPVDIASSSFSEEDTVFGGARNLKAGLANVSSQYSPEAIGVATTCLAETIGEDVPRILADHVSESGNTAPPLIHVSTPAYAGTHIDGFHDTVRRVVEQFASRVPAHDGINILPGFLSAEDLRYVKELLEAFDLPFTLLPDYSATLDGATWSEYRRLQAGGTRLADIAKAAGARATVEFGRTLARVESTAAAWLNREYGVHRVSLGTPIGLRETDRLIEQLENLAGEPCPGSIGSERGRLIDSFVDGHKYVFGQRAAVFGDPDLVIGICSFLNEIGVQPVLCATGSRGAAFKPALHAVLTDVDTTGLRVLTGADHAEISVAARDVEPSLLFGSSKGYPLARELGQPLIRIGFPVHDRLGGQRILHIGYRGAQRLFDQIVNIILEQRQDASETGYSYL
jgi:nitrogenase molybdenum-iron protein NifN